MPSSEGYAYHSTSPNTPNRTPNRTPTATPVSSTPVSSTKKKKNKHSPIVKPAPGLAQAPGQAPRSDPMNNQRERAAAADNFTQGPSHKTNTPDKYARYHDMSLYYILSM